MSDKNQASPPSLKSEAMSCLLSCLIAFFMGVMLTLGWAA